MAAFGGLVSLRNNSLPQGVFLADTQMSCQVCPTPGGCALELWSPHPTLLSLSPQPCYVLQCYTSSSTCSRMTHPILMVPQILRRWLCLQTWGDCQFSSLPLKGITGSHWGKKRSSGILPAGQLCSCLSEHLFPLCA